MKLIGNVSGWLVLAVILNCFSLVVRSQTTDYSFRKALSDKAGFGPTDISALDDGKLIVKTLTTNDKEVVAIVGIIRIKDLPSTSMSDFRSSITQRDNKTVRAGGKFSDPPTDQDLKDLDLEEKDLEALKKCVVGDCDMNMSAESIRQFGMVDWDSSDRKPVVNQLFRSVLLRYALDYSSGGDRTLGEYENRKKNVDLPEVHRSLLANSLFVADLSPELNKYLGGYPTASLKGAESELYWSTINFGLKPAIALTHTIAYDGSRAGLRQYFVANKQIYASRYLDASLSFSMLISFGSSESGGYLIFTDRSMSDALGGILGGVARSVVENEAIERVKGVLSSAELRLISGPNRSAGPDPDITDSHNDAVPFYRNPIVIVAVSIAIAVIVFFLLRRRGRQ
ncbi:MAG TPA: hypothetical protein PLP07_05765 [Pyrinomonadaceae bacterium]|nr:hypothetical protein [Chloracidobacterium sp.]MBP9935143.1 hypothetical protein [Pyrinomonadaceae bacterium]MBK7803430.1 hypothetical protein [Chloracidobacterium sp.]MBL0241206.1 hypothetical protein [Chloracidobacterium sp.]HQX55414.1 hypothetical protein [Pyrinomonadaceae bacterium]